MEVLRYDVLIVGAGPAGLSAAIRLKQLAITETYDLKICVVEKAAEVGGHILSGAVLEPRALDELLPQWRQDDTFPTCTPVVKDQFLFLTAKQAWRLPTPPQMRNTGNVILSLGNMCRWLARQAEALGVEIYSGFAAVDPLINEHDQMFGVRTGAMGIDKSGEMTAQYQPGVELHARWTLIAEGCRGSLAKKLMHHYHLQHQPQTYGLGIKEVWEIKPELHQLGLVVHSVGWPLDFKTYGGSFIYHHHNNQVSVGMVVGLDYQNPYLNPYEEMQRFKTHPYIRKIFEGGRRISYGARALNEGGFQSIPTLEFPGGVLIGCAAGFLNVPKIKGIHTAMKSGMVAAEAIMVAAKEQRQVISYTQKIKDSWICSELKGVRNIRPGFRWGLMGGLLNAAMETYVLRGKTPWTLSHHYDHLSLKQAINCQPIAYPKADAVLTFDKLNSVSLTNTMHREGQPCHLQLKDPSLAISINLLKYDAPEQRYCPAGVYEIVYLEPNKTPILQINSQNCIHCKSCDIKDPMQNINWVPPEGGEGPSYSEM